MDGCGSPSSSRSTSSAGSASKGPSRWSRPDQRTGVGLCAGPGREQWAAVVFGGVPRVSKFSPTGVVLDDFPSGSERRPRRSLRARRRAVADRVARHQTFPDRVAKITTSGAVTEFIAPVSPFVNDIAVGPDGNLWTVETVDPTGPTLAVRRRQPGPARSSTSRPARTSAKSCSAPIQPVGDAAPGGRDRPHRHQRSGGPLPAATAGSAPDGLLTGPDGNLWVVQTKPPQLARVTPEPPARAWAAAGRVRRGRPARRARRQSAARDGGGPGGAHGERPACRPADLRRRPRADPATGVAGRHKRATTLRYTLSETATATLRIERARAGRRIAARAAGRRRPGARGAGARATRSPAR